MHRRNMAKRAICTFKEHFKSLREDFDTKFTKHILCQLITQVNITLNLLQQACLHPYLSSYHAIWGAFNYNRTPLNPPCTCVIVRENPKQQSNWDDNGVEEWYIGPSIKCYHSCYRCYISSTGVERVSDTVQFFPSKVAMSALSSQDKATNAIRDILTIIGNLGPATPFLKYGHKAKKYVEQLAYIFSTNTSPKQ